MRIGIILTSILVTVFFSSCNQNKEAFEKFSPVDNLTILLSDTETFLYNKIGVGIFKGNFCLVKFNTITGNLNILDVSSNKPILEVTIEDDGPEGFNNLFFTVPHVIEDKVYLINGPSGQILSVNSSGLIETTLKLPIDADLGFAYMYNSEGNRLFHKDEDSFFIGFYPDHPKSGIYKRPLQSVLKIDSTHDMVLFAPLPKENIANTWGNDHMNTGPFGIYSKSKNAFITGFSNKNELSVFSKDGLLQESIVLDLPDWKNPEHFPIDAAQLETVSNDVLWEIKRYGESLPKIWKIYEFAEGYLLEVVHGNGSGFFPDFSIYKFDLDFNFLSKKDFIGHENTFYQSFQFGDAYYLFNQHAYEENEDELVFDRYGFDDI
ncbi:DUF4221 family protein [Cecembia lonarensis]|uniref:DUF4221 domain-containing protein n=1 Tax=Cecembia lonarensis (strain CCUG 58316 / KCTC 22772 / LW9) TaxID=1225176 RepID=K1KXX4_CECL9|nr:DUF4221 family protein [Cecembia lonarensis]EKB47311.1 hypothetical protein B879_04086 [Cecembia lonarensis LW9]